jgi:4-hydroxy-3-polyprenylbenzoate decarboxylase
VIEECVLALGVQAFGLMLQKEIENLFKLLSAPKEGILDKLKMLQSVNQFASWMPACKKWKRRMPGNSGLREPDITKLPVITCWPKDGGPFVTLPVIHTKDPNTGIRNVRDVQNAGL